MSPLFLRCFGTLCCPNVWHCWTVPRVPSGAADSCSGCCARVKHVAAGAGKRSGAKSDPVRRRSNHAWTEDQAGRKVVCQNRRGRGLAGAHRRRHTKQERCEKIQTLQLHSDTNSRCTLPLKGRNGRRSDVRLKLCHAVVQALDYPES